MEQQQLQPEEQTNDIALIEQDKSTVKILQEDDLKTVKDAMEKVSGFKRKYTPKKLAVTDIDKKEQKEKLKLAISDLRTTRTDLDKTRKVKIKPYQDTIAFINGNYNKAIEIIELMELPLKEIKSDVEEKILAREQAEENAKRQRVNDRVSKLLDAGITFNDGYYQISSDEFEVSLISLGIVDLETMTDGIFDNVLSQVIEKNAIITKAQNEKDEVTRIAEQQKIAKELEDKRLFEEQQLELKKEQEALRKEREEMDLMRKEIQVEKDRIAAEKFAEQVRLSNEAAAESKKQINARYDQLIALGMKLSANHGYNVYYVYEDINIDNTTEICLFNESEWNTLIEKITPIITERKMAVKKKAIEEKAIADKAIVDKAMADKKIQDEKVEQMRKDALLKAGDLAQWNDLVLRLDAVLLPEMKSKEFKDKVNVVRDFINDCK